MMDLAAEIRSMTGEDVSACYFCQKCSAGCPTALEMDYRPAQVLKMVQMGLRDELLASRAIWLCVGCETCGTRCPNAISVGPVMDALKRMAAERGGPVPEARSLALHRAFLESIRRLGRVHEVTMLAEYKLSSRDLLSDLPLGLRMFLHGKLKLRPRPISGRRQVRRLLRREDRE